MIQGVMSDAQKVHNCVRKIWICDKYFTKCCTKWENRDCVVIVFVLAWIS